MPQEYDCRRQMYKALKVFRMIFVAHDQAAKVEQPGKETLDFVSPHVAAQRASVLGGHAPVDFIGRNQLGAVLLHELFVELVTVVSLVANQPFGWIGHHARVHRGRDQFYFSRRSAFCPQGERKTLAVCNAHDLGALAPLGFPNQSPPFLAGTKVPSTKHSFKSNPPASCKCWARVGSNFSSTPDLTQFWKRRCAVWYGPYRGGRSFQGAPVRKIHNTPFNTLRRSLQGRPRPSSRTGSSGRMVSNSCHCSSVKSIHNYLYINRKGTSTKFNHL